MNRFFKVSILLLAFLGFQAQSSAQTVSAPGLSDDDKAAIVRTVLDLWFSRAKALPPAEGAGLLKFDTLSTEDMSPTLASELTDLKLLLRNSKQLKRLGQQSTPVRFLRVSFGGAGTTPIGVTVAVISRINGTTMDAHTYHYLFEKTDGHWHGKLTIIHC